MNFDNCLNQHFILFSMSNLKWKQALTFIFANSLACCANLLEKLKKHLKANFCVFWSLTWKYIDCHKIVIHSINKTRLTNQNGCVQIEITMDQSLFLYFSVNV